MARKLNVATADKVRAHIQGLMLVNLLQDHARGKIELSDARRDSAKFLLGYVLPRPAQAVEHQGDIKITWKS